MVAATTAIGLPLQFFNGFSVQKYNAILSFLSFPGSAWECLSRDDSRQSSLTYLLGFVPQPNLQIKTMHGFGEGIKLRNRVSDSPQ